VSEYDEHPRSYRAVPKYWLTNLYPCCTRLDLFKQYVVMDVQAVFPASGPMGAGYDRWMWDAFLVAVPRNAPSLATRSALRSATARTQTTGRGVLPACMSRHRWAAKVGIRLWLAPDHGLSPCAGYSSLNDTLYSV
jgi:hypothetical protein